VGLLRAHACWDCGFESCREHGCLSVVSVVYFQVQASAMGWSLFQRSSTYFGVYECVREASIVRRRGSTRAIEPWEKNYCNINWHLMPHHNSQLDEDNDYCN
jgi:hypothetical protein